MLSLSGNVSAINLLGTHTRPATCAAINNGAIILAVH